MPLPSNLKGRYEIRDILGQGGMGLVYRAFDAVVKREVALKTLRDAPTRAALQLFYKECEVLAALSHPNIIEIFDIGEFEEEGKTLPYFVMPLLPGTTLDRLIRDSSHRLTVDRVVEIMLQTCRGLHAAHERGLVHRDLKPSNLFVMQDDSVKIIDFGVAHMVDTHSSMGPKGTLLYMAPEQLQMKPPSPLSDLFSLGVVCYEMLTRRRPFERPTETEIVEAILHYTPPPASDLNPAVNQPISRVIHKAMAKQPWHRFANVREFADTLQKGLRNEPIEFFDPARIQPRIQRAAKAFETGDHLFAAEIVNELEAEGHVEPSITMLRRQIEQTVRQQTISQLLEHARTRFDNEEYPLSLQKIHEVLQLDPDNSAALGLKTSIEKKQTAVKIDEWFRLARRHIENHAYNHAREAVQNVLQLKPKETRALEMLGEVDRLEREYLRVRSEKEALYQSALQAWQNGDVSSALTRLDRVLELDRMAPDTSERAASYQSLYNQVRSEQDAIKNTYAEARKHLADGNFAQALALCNDTLARRPGHALFQALKVDIEERQRQELSARIAEIDRQAEAEPDLDRRVSMIEEAFKAHPGEPHFEKALRLARDKRDLVNSIVGKARMHEERGQYTEALGQWEILQTIYSQYPGLSFEMDRLTARRDQAARAEAKARWIERIERCVAASDCHGVIDLVRNALAEFPGDTDFEELEKVARQTLERRAEAQRLLARGQELWRLNRCEQGMEYLRRAHQLDADDAGVRAALVDALVEQARPVVEKDWRAAEGLVQQALDLDPGHLLAKSLRTLIHDRRREEEVVRVFTQARQLRASGDLRTALSQTEQCLAAYPLEPRLVQLRDILTRELQELERKQARAADLEELQRLAGNADQLSTVLEVESALDRVQEIAQRHREDSEIRPAAAALERRLAVVLSGLRSAQGGPTAALAPPPSTPKPKEAAALAGAEAPPTRTEPDLPPTVVMGTAPVTAEEPQTPVLPTQPAAPVAPRSAPAASKPPTAPPALKARRPWIWIAVGGAVVLAALIAVLVVARRGGKPEPAAAVALEVRTSPPGAAIRIDNVPRGVSNLHLRLAPGRYSLDAALDGYEPLSTTLQVSEGSTAPVEFTLQPLAQTVRILSNVEGGQATVDDQPSKPLLDGQVVLESLAPGKHALKIADRYGETAFSLQIVPGSAPLVSGPVDARNVVALLVSNAGGRARVYSNVTGAALSVDGQPAGTLGPDGLELSNFPAGTHELAFGEGREHRTFVVDVGTTPMLTAVLQSDRNIGTILLVTGEDGVTVFLNGEKYPRVTRRGQLRISREPKEYRIRVAKEGFRDEPERLVSVRKGEEVKVDFQLTALPSTAALVLRGATPGAQVVLDQNLVGATDSAGNFSSSNIPPGEHMIELRKDRFKPRQFRRQFEAGRTVQPAANELTLESVWGTLKLTTSPAGAKVTIQRAGEPQARPVSESSLSLPSGKYTVVARAPGYADQTRQIEVPAGQAVPLTLTLVPEKTARATPANAMDGWQDPQAWKPEGRWHVHRGGEFVLYRATPGGGSFAFTLLGQAGGFLRGKRLQWVVDYTDPRNYLLFQFDKETFRRIRCVNGKRTEMLRLNHGVPQKDYIVATLQIDVTPATVVHRVRKDGKWVVLDTYSAPGQNFTLGKFGFYIPGKDELSISDFGFYPAQ